MTERTAALVAAAGEDEALRTALQRATSLDELVQVAAAAGFEVSAADFEVTAASDVSDAELEGAAAAGANLISAWVSCFVEDCR